MEASPVDSPNPPDPSTWIESYGDYLYRYALMRVSNASLAEDLVQETFLAGIKSLKNFGGRSTLKTWLTGILKFKIMDYYRKSSREKTFTQLSSFYEDEEHEHFGENGHWLSGDYSPAGWSAEQWENVDRQEFMTQFLQCAEKLPPKIKQVYLMREVDGIDSKEIVEKLEITPQNLWTILHRARMALRKCLQDNWSSPDKRL
ncbi:sigma-70 family RNA polymerase sigma factor [Opitutia bacterium ISCC 51]|nr:sigma-70 family RNA polymerase sigma factor [Opitutae bacterium ISCC 51]QXD28031.1 sigma-70 family RNA polymerase sigma factor [Opitutae bacterium ISCC 52]